MDTCPTPAHLRTDATGRPYFVWDTQITWEELVEVLGGSDRDAADYWLARVMRDAKPDDALELASWQQMAEAWPRIAHRLGKERDFWAWWLNRRGFDVGA